MILKTFEGKTLLLSSIINYDDEPLLLILDKKPYLWKLKGDIRPNDEHYRVIAAESALISRYKNIMKGIKILEIKRDENDMFKLCEDFFGKYQHPPYAIEKGAWVQGFDYGTRDLFTRSEILSLLKSLTELPTSDIDANIMIDTIRYNSIESITDTTITMLL